MWSVDTDLIMHRLRRRGGDFFAAARETRVLHPGGEIDRPPAVYEDDLDRITGIAPGVSLAERIKVITGGIQAVGATVAHRFANIGISQGMAYSGSGRLQLRRQKLRLIRPAAPVRIDGPTAIACNLASTSVYYHWAVEQLPRELAIARLGARPVTLPSAKPFWHEPHLRKTLDLYADPVTDADLGSCWVIQDRPKNAYFATLFEDIRTKTVRPPAADASDLVYLRRGSRNTDKREIADDAAFTAYLEAAGFKILDVETASLDQIAGALSAVKLTCTIEGSQAAHHLMYAPRGAALLVLMPSDRFNQVLKEVCDVLAMPFGFVLGAVTGDKEYAYDPRTVDRVLARLSALG